MKTNLLKCFTLFLIVSAFTAGTNRVRHERFAKTYHLAPIDSILQVLFEHDTLYVLDTIVRKYPTAKTFQIIYFDSFDNTHTNRLLMLLEDTSACFFTESYNMSVYPCRTNVYASSTRQIEIAGLIEGLREGRYPYHLHSCSIINDNKGKVSLNTEYKNELRDWLIRYSVFGAEPPFVYNGSTVAGYLDYLRRNYYEDYFALFPDSVPASWLDKSNITYLLSRLDSREKVAMAVSINAGINIYSFSEMSTEGLEALHLLYCMKNGYNYPRFMVSKELGVWNSGDRCWYPDSAEVKIIKDWMEERR